MDWWAETSKWLGVVLASGVTAGIVSSAVNYWFGERSKQKEVIRLKKIDICMNWLDVMTAVVSETRAVTTEEINIANRRLSVWASEPVSLAANEVISHLKKQRTSGVVYEMSNEAYEVYNDKLHYVATLIQKELSIK